MRPIHLQRVPRAQSATVEVMDAALPVAILPRQEDFQLVRVTGLLAPLSLSFGSGIGAHRPVSRLLSSLWSCRIRSARFAEEEVDL